MPFIPPMLASSLEDPRRLEDPHYTAEPREAAGDGELGERVGIGLPRTLLARAGSGERLFALPHRARRLPPRSRRRTWRRPTAPFLEHVWRPLLLKAGLRYRKAHSMRHTFATWALEGSEAKGIPPSPILAVRDWMGHASVQETEGYLHRNRASHAPAVDRLDAYVTG